ncbi:MAG TPA: Sir2 family NAD-dependent protein deacetylase [Microbacteriaceae bacterium]|nr:Sir2 family NAD-dependent protein deacetylase [Microbacteriaceae bacterium]HQX35595.1 Sir2 family NAD-dependent protein deacetylase [Microbacteriaceae bacterium]HQZ48454.1 Sir2 family NAD-dependent protein deacetylase [Microbacteriaceae bacterium]HRA08689.1 Sir2 family NAD-dependent protein deacetylase [Microbacteriaceae bacterium]
MTQQVGELDAAAEQSLARAVEVLSGRRLAFLTGAGVSTDSGIPDYRGVGTPPRNAPMTGPQFLADAAARRRYWIGSHLGWHRFSTIQPNAGHRAVAELEQRGIATGVVTQNVDGLHVRAGSARVVDLHGTMNRVNCLRCGQSFAREDVSEQLERQNPWIAVSPEVALGPDGDVRPESADGFIVPDCTVCGGVLKPDVVFFGEFVPAERFREAEAIVHSSEALVVAGSSLVVNSGIRLVERARRRELPVVIVNRGETRADARAAVKIDAGTSEVLTALAAELPQL